MKISAAGNLEVPAYLTLKELGYEVIENNDTWTASKNQNSFNGNSPLEILGAIKVFEIRGDNWRATDNEIEDFIKLFDLK